MNDLPVMVPLDLIYERMIFQKHPPPQYGTTSGASCYVDFVD
jgi:hypothetical protein